MKRLGIITILLSLLGGSASHDIVARSADSLKVSILGDSYSTFRGHVSPDWNFVWYSSNGRAGNDVNSVEQIWWNILIREMGYKLEKNNSFSGSTISFTGYRDKRGRNMDYSDRSFVIRASDLGSPDIILVCGATNDSWIGVPVGDYVWNRWTNEDLHYFRPAMAKMCSELKTLYPEARIVFILNSELKDDIDESVHTITSHYRLECIDLHDIDKQLGHPSIAGMRAIASQVEEVLSAR